MKNNIKLPTGVDSVTFKNQITDYLSNNLSDYLCTALSNLLAIDYAGRLKAKPPIQEYIDVCIKRLKNYLGYKIVTDEDFGAAMTLFTIAITPEEESNNIKNQTQDILIESIISSHFGDLASSDQKEIKLVLKDLLGSKNSKEIMNFINSDPELFYSISMSAIPEKTKQQKISKIIEADINKILSQSKIIDNKINGIKGIVSQVVLGIGILAASSLGLVMGGLILPAIIIPAVAVSVKLAPRIGAKISDMIIDSNENIQVLKTEIINSKRTIEIDGLQKGHSQEIQLLTNVTKSTEKTIDITDNFNVVDRVNTKQPGAKKTDLGKGREV